MAAGKYRDCSSRCFVRRHHFDFLASVTVNNNDVINMKYASPMKVTKKLNQKVDRIFSSAFCERGKTGCVDDGDGVAGDIES